MKDIIQIFLLFYPLPSCASSKHFSTHKTLPRHPSIPAVLPKVFCRNTVPLKRSCATHLYLPSPPTIFCYYYFIFLPSIEVSLSTTKERRAIVMLLPRGVDWSDRVGFRGKKISKSIKYSWVGSGRILALFYPQSEPTQPEHFRVGSDRVFG